MQPQGCPQRTSSSCCGEGFEEAAVVWTCLRFALPRPPPVPSLPQCRYVLTCSLQGLVAEQRTRRTSLWS